MGKQDSRRLLNLTIGFAIAAVLLWFFFKDIDWSDVGASLVTANVWLLAAAFFGNVASLLIRSWRWKILLSPLKSEVHFQPAWKYFTIGFAVSSLLPGRIGELLRPYLWARDQQARFTSALATVVTERIIDLTAVLLLLSTIFIFPDALGPGADDPESAALILTIKGFGLLALIVAVAATLFLMLLRLRTQWALAIVSFCGRPLPEKMSSSLLRMTQSFADGLGGLRGWRQIGGVAGATVLNWVLVSACFWARSTARQNSRNAG